MSVPGDSGMQWIADRSLYIDANGKVLEEGEGDPVTQITAKGAAVWPTAVTQYGLKRTEDGILKHPDQAAAVASTAADAEPEAGDGPPSVPVVGEPGPDTVNGTPVGGSEGTVPPENPPVDANSPSAKDHQRVVRVWGAKIEDLRAFAKANNIDIPAGNVAKKVLATAILDAQVDVSALPQNAAAEWKVIEAMDAEALRGLAIQEGQVFAKEASREEILAGLKAARSDGG